MEAVQDGRGRSVTGSEGTPMQSASIAAAARRPACRGCAGQRSASGGLRAARGVAQEGRRSAAAGDVGYEDLAAASSGDVLIGLGTGESPTASAAAQGAEKEQFGARERVCSG